MIWTGKPQRTERTQALEQELKTAVRRNEQAAQRLNYVAMTEVLHSITGRMG